MMKTALRIFLASALLPVAVFAASFEGKMNLKMTSDGGKSQDIQYSLKGDKLRLDFPGMKGAGGMIVDTTKREMTMIMDEQKMYMSMPMPTGAEAAPAGGKQEDVKLEKTGQTEKILGYLATKFLATHDGTTTELWLAEGLGTFFSPAGGNPMGGARGSSPAPQGWERALAGKELFPLRVVGKNKAGKETFRMETTAINKQSLPDSLFTPPAGYQKFDMGGMGGMMKGMLPGMGR